MSLLHAPVTRRRSLQGAMALGAAATLAGCADAVPQDVGLALAPTPLTDPAVLNFALNLEYLEAEYYLRGVTGQGLAAADIGPQPGAVRGGRRVPFRTPAFQSFSEEIAEDELAHVRFLRQAIDGQPLVELSRPAIDFDGGFARAAQAAGLPAGFDPFADEISFFLGAFLFEDVGVNAYKGGATLIASKEFLSSAARILAAEGYHAGLIRTQLYLTGRSDVIAAANAISDARDAVGHSGDVDQGLTLNGAVNIVPTDANGLVYGRSPEAVVRIVYLTDQAEVGRGGFFPEGLNGVVNLTT